MTDAATFPASPPLSARAFSSKPGFLVIDDVGSLGGIHGALRVAKWAMAQRYLPTVSAIRMRFNVSRATAYRWQAALRDELDLVPRQKGDVEVSS